MLARAHIVHTPTVLINHWAGPILNILVELDSKNLSVANNINLREPYTSLRRRCGAVVRAEQLPVSHWTSVRFCNGCPRRVYAT
jgi:hypothetical protein